MSIKDLIVKDYPTVTSFEGVNSIEENLLKHNYLVVLNDDGVFQGILTPYDIIKRPKRVVIDCIGKPVSISTEECLATIIEKFEKYQSVALPVVHENQLIGVLEKKHLVHYLQNRVDTLLDESKLSQRAKEAFLHNLSHEIRSPLNGVIGFLELLDCKNSQKSSSSDKFTVMLKRCTDRFLTTMNNMIELSLLQSGEKFEINPESFTLKEVIDELMELFSFSIALFNRELNISIIDTKEDLVLYTDKSKFKNILFHLIENAYKYSSPSNETIRVGYTISKSKKEVDVFVVNTGLGIHSEFKERVFKAFEQLEHKDVFNYGLGIGLPLVKEFTNLLGGNVDFNCVNNETTFYLKFPFDSIMKFG